MTIQNSDQRSVQDLNESQHDWSTHKEDKEEIYISIVSYFDEQYDKEDKEDNVHAMTTVIGVDCMCWSYCSSKYDTILM